MLRKMILLCLVVSIMVVGCNGDEPEEGPPSGPPETHSVDCSVQNLIALLEDVPPNGLIVNLSDCNYTFDEVNNIPDDPEDDTFGGVALPAIEGQVTINGTGSAAFTRSSADGTEPFRFLYVAPGGSLTLNDIRFSSGNINQEMTDLDRKGGAVFSYMGALTINNCVFENNQAHQGGAVANENGGLSITDSTFTDNQSYMEGGAVAIYREEMEFSEILESTFSGNMAGMSGGAVYSSGRLQLAESTFELNQSERYGGAFASAEGVVFATDVVFDQNIGDLGGGIAVFGSDEQTEFHNCSFTNNQVTAAQDSRGGGIYLYDVDEAEFYTCQMNANSAENGGALYAVNSNVIIDNGSSIQDNQADIMGGGLYFDHESTAVVSLTDIIGNTAGHYGGGIHNFGALTLESVNILQNSAQDFLGGGISNHYGGVYINNSALADNTASLGGGGLESDSYASIYNSTFSGNQADTGGAIFFEGQAEIASSTIAFNDGLSGSAIFSSYGEADVKNSIIVENTTYNCAMAINAIGDNLDDDGTCAGFNISGDARLEALDYNGGPTLNHAIGHSSDAFDAALDCSDISGMTVAADQRGVMRPQSDACDIGAFELEWAAMQPLPQFPHVVFNLPTYCRSKPDSSSSAIASFQPQDTAEVLGRNINLTWYQVAPEGTDKVCWVWVGAVEFVGELDDVEVVPAEIVDVEEASDTCSPPPGGCPMKEAPMCWDEEQCKCVPCS
jgi:hypothetical protein